MERYELDSTIRIASGSGPRCVNQGHFFRDDAACARF